MLYRRLILLPFSFIHSALVASNHYDTVLQKKQDVLACFCDWQLPVCNYKIHSDPLLTQNRIGTGRAGRRQRKIRPANSGKQLETESKRLRFFFETTYGPEGRGFESLTACHPETVAIQRLRGFPLSPYAVKNSRFSNAFLTC